MIHVQIASQLTARGLAGVRWVLVEPIDPPTSAPDLVAEPAPATRDAAPADAAPQTAGTASALRLGALKLLVVASGLAAALWTAHVQVGPPGAAQPAPAAAPAKPPAVPALSTPVRPGAAPLAPAEPDAAPLAPIQPHAAPPAATPGTAPVVPAATPRLQAAL